MPSASIAWTPQFRLMRKPIRYWHASDCIACLDELRWALKSMALRVTILIVDSAHRLVPPSVWACAPSDENESAPRGQQMEHGTGIAEKSEAIEDLSSLEAFSRCWQNLEPQLIRAARARALPLETAEDLVQDVAILALRKRHEILRCEDLNPWAHARLYWLFLDYVRKTSRQPKTVPEGLFSRILGFLRAEPTQEQDAIASELHDRLGKLIVKLPDRQRVAMKALLEGLPTSEVAKSLDVEEATVRSLQRHGRNALTKLIAESEK